MRAYLTCSLAASPRILNTFSECGIWLLCQVVDENTDTSPVPGEGEIKARALKEHKARMRERARARHYDELQV